MLNGIKAERLKLKKDAMFWVGTFLMIVVPLLIVIKDCFFAVPPDEILEWVMSGCLVNFLVLSVISGFVITNMVQREYQAGTIINILTSSPSRTIWLLSKLVVWFIWYALMLAVAALVSLRGARLIYPSQWNGTIGMQIAGIYTRTGLLYFLTSIPLLWVTVLQKKLFYPSVLTSIGFTIALVGGMNVSQKMLLPASLIPWSAVPVLSIYQIGSPYREIGLLAIIGCGALGIVLACVSFLRQDQ